MSSPSSCARDGHLDIRNTNCEDNTDRRVLFGPPKSESNPISLVFFSLLPEVSWVPALGVSYLPVPQLQILPFVVDVVRLQV